MLKPSPSIKGSCKQPYKRLLRGIAAVVSPGSAPGYAIVGDGIEGFQVKRIRSGIETLLAAQGISREVRGHPQSHGLSGVQARHYDGHDYMPKSAGRSRCFSLSFTPAAPAWDTCQGSSSKWREKHAGQDSQHWRNSQDQPEV